MDARLRQTALVLSLVFAAGANYRTENFLVTAPSAPLAQQIGETAEHYRRQLAVEWLGRPLPKWDEPCPIRAEVHERLPAGGQTSFYFMAGKPRGWQMIVQGSTERILDSVLPHEITHTLFATHFGRPLPRWADEGACTTVEHPSERAKQEKWLIEFLSSRPSRGIPFNVMFQLQEYPDDILPLYSQGYALAEFLIAQGGKQKFVRYLEEGLRTNNWPAATRVHYGYPNLSSLQVAWVEWVARGRPAPIPSDLAGKSAPDTNLHVASDQPRTSIAGSSDQRTLANGSLGYLGSLSQGVRSNVFSGGESNKSAQGEIMISRQSVRAIHPQRVELIVLEPARTSPISDVPLRVSEP